MQKSSIVDFSLVSGILGLSIATKLLYVILYDHKITGFVKARKTFPRMQLTGQMKIDKEKQ